MENLIKNLRNRLDLIEKRELLFDQLLESIDLLIEASPSRQRYKKRKRKERSKYREKFKTRGLGSKSLLVQQIEKFDDPAVRSAAMGGQENEPQGLRYSKNEPKPEDLQGIEPEYRYMINLDKYPLPRTDWKKLVRKGIDLALVLHRAFKVNNKAGLGQKFFHPSGNLSLEEFKKNYDNFMIFLGPLGWAAIKVDEDYLRKQFEKNSEYKPENDDMVPYLGIFSTLDGDKPFKWKLNPKDPEGIEDLQKQVIQNIKGTRGGSYGKTETQSKRLSILAKARERETIGRGTETIADEIKFVIGNKPITVWQLTQRDVAHSEIDPRRLMGRRSGDISTTSIPGLEAPIERSKIEARKPDNQLIFKLASILNKPEIRNKIKKILLISINNDPNLDPSQRYDKKDILDTALDNIFNNQNQKNLIHAIGEVFENTGFLKLSEIEKVIQEYKEKTQEINISDKLALLKIYFSQGNDLLQQRNLVKREFLGYFIRHLTDKLVQI